MHKRDFYDFRGNLLPCIYIHKINLTIHLPEFKTCKHDVVKYSLINFSSIHFFSHNNRYLKITPLDIDAPYSQRLLENLNQFKRH